MIPALALAAAVAATHSGAVQSATALTLYLDAGAADGLARGTTIELRRNGRPAGSCRVVAVSEHHASCEGRGAVGDTFTVQRPHSAPVEPARRPPPPPRPAELAAAQRSLKEATFEKVGFAATPHVAAAALPGRGEVQFSHATWASTGSGPWHQERLDARISGAPAFGGFELWADVSARHWSARPDVVSSRPDDSTQLYVWEAALRRSAPQAVQLAFGRLRPWAAPGATVIDGAQIGWATRGGSEIGVFGGVVPDLITLAPSIDRGTGGAYFRIEQAGAPGALLRLARGEARVAFTTSPERELGQRVEGELLGQLWLTREVSVSTGLRLAAGNRTAPGGLDSFRLDLGARPLPQIYLSGGFRYQGLALLERDGPGLAGYGGAARHADLSAAWEPLPWLSLSAVSGVAKDLTTSVSRAWVGPEVGLPRLFGAIGGLSVGYAEETGWASGRNAWVQVVTHARIFQLVGRLSWARTRGLEPTDDDELGASVMLSAHLGERFFLRVAALGRLAGVVGGSPFNGTGQRGGSFDAGLGGVF